MILAFYEGAIFVRNGIGVVQNPPFFIHLIAGFASIPLVHILFARVLALRREPHGPSSITEFVRRLRGSRASIALYSMASLVGLAVFAYNIVLGFAYEITIYDSPEFPFTFASYQVIRGYLYLFCYPLVFTAPPVVAFYLFRSLRREDIQYQPFHIDGLGGMRKYFEAVDRPIYAVQSVAVLIALMNYIGWGRMEFAPLALAISAPILVTLLGVHLFVHFHRVVASKRRREMQKIRDQQMLLYEAVGSLAELKSRDCLDLLDKLEATERLATLVSKTSRRGLQKYFFNLMVLAAPYVLRPLGQALVERFMDS
jgi:hypothetical protein